MLTNSQIRGILTSLKDLVILHFVLDFTSCNVGGLSSLKETAFNYGQEFEESLKDLFPE